MALDFSTFAQLAQRTYPTYDEVNASNKAVTDYISPEAQASRLKLSQLNRQVADQEAMKQALMQPRENVVTTTNPAYADWEQGTKKLADLTQQYEKAPVTGMDQNDYNNLSELMSKYSGSAPNKTIETRTPMSLTQKTLEYAQQTGNQELYQKTLDKALDDAGNFMKLTNNPQVGIDYINGLTGKNLQYLGAKDNLIHVKDGESIFAYDPVKKEATQLIQGADKEVKGVITEEFTPDGKQSKRILVNPNTGEKIKDVTPFAAVKSQVTNVNVRGNSGGLPKPPPGYRYTSDGNLEVIPGGPAAQKQADRATQQDNAKATFDETIAVIDKLANHPGRKAGTGLSSVIDPRNYIPGTDAKDFSNELKSFDGKLFLANVSKMKGMGALSDAEGKKITAAAGAIQPGMSDEAFLQNIREIQRNLAAAKQRIESGNLLSGGASPSRPNQPVKIGGYTVKVKGGQ